MTASRPTVAPANGARRVIRTPSAEGMIRPMVAVLFAIAAVGVAWLWFRDSPLVQVEHVEITGLQSSQQEDVRAALRQAASDMTSLNVREDALRAAVAPYESVADVRADGEFPDKLSIHVTERRMLGVVEVGGVKTPVAADGRLLLGVEAPAALPALGSRGVTAGAARLSDGRSRGTLAVLAAAPPALHARIERVRRGPGGVTVEMRDGPDLIFGNRSRLQAKWAAAARVLAEPAAVGAVYLDLRLPERVAAGGVAPTPTPGPAETPTPTPPTEAGGAAPAPSDSGSSPAQVPVTPAP